MVAVSFRQFQVISGSVRSVLLDSAQLELNLNFC